MPRLVALGSASAQPGFMRTPAARATTALPPPPQKCRDPCRIRPWTIQGARQVQTVLSGDDAPRLRRAPEWRACRTSRGWPMLLPRAHLTLAWGVALQALQAVGAHAPGRAGVRRLRPVVGQPTGKSWSRHAVPTRPECRPLSFKPAHGGPTAHHRFNRRWPGANGGRAANTRQVFGCDGVQSNPASGGKIFLARGWLTATSSGHRLTVQQRTHKTSFTGQPVTHCLRDTIVGVFLSWEIRVRGLGLVGKPLCECNERAQVRFLRGSYGRINIVSGSIPPLDASRAHNLVSRTPRHPTHRVARRQKWRHPSHIQPCRNRTCDHDVQRHSFQAVYQLSQEG